MQAQNYILLLHDFANQLVLNLNLEENELTLNTRFNLQPPALPSALTSEPKKNKITFISTHPL